MKPIRLLALSMVTTLTASAQNTFPASGNIGIGTISPEYPLEISSPSSLSLAYQRTGVSAKKWGFNSDNYNTYWHNLTDGILALTVSNDGNIGIGTTNPLYKLDVRTGTDQRLLVRSGNNWGGGNTGIALDARNDAESGSIPLRIRASTIALDGNVGIGTTNALSPLTVFNSYGGTGVYALTLATAFSQGNTYAINPFIHGVSNGGFSIYDVTNSTPRLVIQQDSGNVGIGTSNPASKLEVVGGGVNLPGGTSTGTANTNPGVITHFNHADGKNYIRGTTIVADTGGNVGIGTTNPAHKLAVNGTIKAKEVIVETTGWSDYVFADDYALAPLAEVEAHIKTNKHLPGIPSATEVATQGVSLGDMQARLLAKIEELTLHQIAQEKELASLRQEVRALREAR
jgi:hypothetical protein